MGGFILETKKLSKNFLGFTAVDKVDLNVKTGNIHALIGPNGAGKTTCFNLLTKFLKPSSGTIYFKGQNITNVKPAEVARKGVIRSFQISAVFPDMTVLENVRIGFQRMHCNTFNFLRSDYSLSSLNNRCRELLSAVDLLEFENHKTSELPYGRKRALEIATTLAMDPELMLLDEPTQGMGLEDVDRITKLIKKVSHGRTILMVEHNMKVVSSIADCITVLAHGEILAEGDYEHVSNNPDVMEAYMGTTDGQLEGAH